MKTETKPTTPDLGELERLAGEATPGPWIANDNHSKTFHAWRIETMRYDNEGCNVANELEGPHAAANAAFIAAANPETVLALIAELRRKEARIRELEAGLEPFAHHAAMVDAKPLRGMGDGLHGIHFGTEWESAITWSDCRRARTLLTETGR